MGKRKEELLEEDWDSFDETPAPASEEDADENEEGSDSGEGEPGAAPAPTAARPSRGSSATHVAKPAPVQAGSSDDSDASQGTPMNDSDQVSEPEQASDPDSVDSVDSDPMAGPRDAAPPASATDKDDAEAPPAKKARKPRHRERAPEPAVEQPESAPEPVADVVAAEIEAALVPLRPPMMPRAKKEKVQRALPAWISHPRPISAHVAGPCGGSACGAACTDSACPNYAGSQFLVEDASWLSDRLKSTLRQEGVDYLFPVQAAVGPAICHGFNSPYTPGDICVSAPTGSGKTLAYVLPIVECLRTRVVRRLRCLVVLPTKDLVVQVSARSYSN
jgi:hypothetical protein